MKFEAVHVEDGVVFGVVGLDPHDREYEDWAEFETRYLDENETFDDPYDVSEITAWDADEGGIIWQTELAERRSPIQFVRDAGADHSFGNWISRMTRSSGI